MTAKSTTVLATAIWLAGASWASAGQAAGQQPTTTRSGNTVSQGNVERASATIQAIDTTNRTVTLKNDKGEEEPFAVSTGMQRFNELKVGQKVDVTYYESIVLQLLKPGETPNVPSYEAALTRAKSKLPAATVATQEKKTVTVASIDSTTPSVTVKTEDGRTITRKVEDRRNIEGLKVGDKIDITYTRAVIASIQ